MCVGTDESKRTKGYMKEITQNNSFENPKNKVVVVTGLGIGEETKGNTVEAFAKMLNAHTVWRSGGCQSGHHITTEDGREQMFSHFGAGTFDGVRTHLKHMVICPTDLFNEALEVEAKGIKNPFDLITIDKECISITPFHRAISRLREIMRGKDKKGTVGMGVGEAVRDSHNPKLTIKAADFFQDEAILEEKIENIRQNKIHQAQELIQGLNQLPVEANDQLEILYDQGLVKLTTKSFKYAASLFKIVDDSYLDELLSKEGSVVCETSHGVLLHPWYGFIPHTTQIDPTCQDILNTLQKENYSGKIIRIGVSRCYMTRHGAGPLVSFNRRMTDSIHETHNNWTEWLGEFRNGNYDIVAMKYAIEISGGKKSFDGLMISYLDVLSQKNEWQICEGYKFNGEANNLEEFFEIENDIITGIKVCPDTRDETHYNHQLQLTKLLNQCQPILTTLKPENNKSIVDTFLNYVEEKIQIPVVAEGWGPKAKDRKIRSGYEHLFAR